MFGHCFKLYNDDGTGTNNYATAAQTCTDQGAVLARPYYDTWQMRDTISALCTGSSGGTTNKCARTWLSP